VITGAEWMGFGIGHAEYSGAEREAVVHARPRAAHFKEGIIKAFYDGSSTSRKNDLRQRQR
jgi:hypothetical protein